MIVLQSTTSIADHIEFIDDVYSSNDIYLAWNVSYDPNDNGDQHESSSTIQYRECGQTAFVAIPVHDVTESYPASSCDCHVFSVTLNNLRPDTIYEIQLSPADTDSHTYQIRTLSSHDDWPLYVEKIAPYAVGAVGAVILAPIALEALGFGSVGITAGSVAAGIQSEIGLVEAGSAFAIMQSAGMAGVSTETSLALALGGTGVVAAISSASQDECGNAQYMELLKDKFETVQQFVIEQMYNHQYEADLSAIKQQVEDYMTRVNTENVREDTGDLWQSVTSNYDKTKDYVKDKVGETREQVTSHYATGKEQVLSAAKAYLPKF